MSKKQSSVIQIRNWIRTNGEMSADGKTITYRCNELDAILEQAHYMHKDEIESAFAAGILTELPMGKDIIPSDFYNETYGE